MKKENSVFILAVFTIVFIVSASMAADSGLEQDKSRQKEDKKAELLERLESGESITIEDLKSAFGYEKEIEEIPPFVPDFRFDYSDRCYPIPREADEWNPEKFREEISRAIEEARRGFEQFREFDWPGIWEDISRAMDRINKEMEEIREKYGNEKEFLPARRGIPII